jgi:two-component system sensor histidine kinase HydH
MKRSANRKPHQPLLVRAALVLLLAALAAGLGLGYLKRMHDRAVHTVATRTVLEQGEKIADYLTEISPFCPTPLSQEQWQLFYRLIDSLHAAQHNLQFVSLAHNGITIINRQAKPLGTGGDQTNTLRQKSGTIHASVEQQVLELGGTEVPVMVFRREVHLPDKGGLVEIEVGLRKTAVDVEERAAARAVTSLFRLSVLTVSVAFGVCLLLLIWLVRRDRLWAERRRQEEHLAFSGMLANGIVHDFRNPMSSVRLDAQMLERELRRPEGARPERLADLATRINRTIGRMDKVFQEFLYLARPMEESHEAVDLTECVRECLETLSPRCEQAGINPVLAWPTPPPRVQASPFALRRALLNVLLNALQFSPPHSQIELQYQRRHDQVELDVLDRGPGIPAAERRRIFDMFVTTRPGGTGLGLFLARTAIRKCGGEIVALPRDGGGTIIRITLPVAQAPKESARPPREPEA